MSAPFDLAEQLRRWRQETEATLAFDEDEIDELEDHLNLTVEGAISEGVSPEQAWQRAIAQLGSSSSLALEFAKSKLLPSFLHLLGSWWKPGLPILFFAGSWLGLTSEKDYIYSSASAAIGLLFLLLFLPGRWAKNAVLAGIGLGFCAIPLLPPLLYNTWGNAVIGVGWSNMSATAGPWQISLGLAGLVALTRWWWKRSRSTPETIPAALAVVLALVFLIALSPFISEVIGNLSIRDMYYLPTSREVSSNDDIRKQFLTWKFLELLIRSITIILVFLPLLLTAVLGAGIALHQGLLRLLKIPQAATPSAFPGRRDLPWALTLVSSGLVWFLANVVEAPFSTNMRMPQPNALVPVPTFGGFEITILICTALFLVATYELMQRLRQAQCLRPFFAMMIPVTEGLVLASVLIWPPLWNSATNLTKVPITSGQPPWLFWPSLLLLVGMIVWQAWWLIKKGRHLPTKSSHWKFDGGELVRLGSSLGLIGAVAGSPFVMVAVTMARESVAMISAMIDWGTSIKNPEKGTFDPTSYFNGAMQTHYPEKDLIMWTTCTGLYLSFCLAAGLGIVMALSGLEFIRFNGFRLYRARKANAWAPKTVAMNE